MKRIICLFLCLLFVFITGCSPKAEHNSSESIKESTSSNTEQNIAESTDGGFYISEALDITNIIRLIPLNGRFMSSAQKGIKLLSSGKSSMAF